MTEIRIHGRGGQGGVTLAKIIATLYYLEGKSVQAFGLYAAERSGAPLQAFVRIDDKEITNRNLIYHPDHVIVIDTALIGEAVSVGLKPGGTILVNSPKHTLEFVELFAGYRVIPFDATAIAVEHGLGTRSVPIVNTTVAGAYAKAFGLPFSRVAAAFAEMRFPDINLHSAKVAYEKVVISGVLPGDARKTEPSVPASRVAGMVEGNTGAAPAVKTSSWATQQPRHTQVTPPCNHVCPAGNDVQGFIALLAQDRVDEALAMLHKTTPFPGVCGRVCPAPCMEACNRAHFDDSVNVRELERYAADHGCHLPKPNGSRDECIAVVGSGPAGLSAAYHLARLGYHVVVYEGGPELGGVLRTGIPAYRLPRDVLDKEIRAIIGLGVEPVVNRKIVRGDLARLSGAYSAIYIATGLQESRTLNIKCLDPEMVMEGIEFLDLANRGEITLAGERVIVVGGGNTAFDAARTALRLGARSVQMVYRRTREEMPAIAEEIDEALAEGIRIEYLATPQTLHEVDEGYVLTCLRNELGAPDASGRRRPQPIAGSEFDLACDRVLLALGQTGDLSVLPEGSKITENGLLVGYVQAPIFVGGDLATGEGTVAAAIGDGRKVAWHIHRQLSGIDLFPPERGDPVPYERLNANYFHHLPRRQGALADPRQRRSNFEEVHEGLSDLSEAARCLSCGVCNVCGTCDAVCPEGMVFRNGNRYEFNYDHCKGCGLCAAECPRNVIMMTQL